ncbi:MAG: trigger factor [Thermoanaerobaculia bacterium]
MAILNYSEVSDSRRVFEIEIPTDEVEKAKQGITRNFARRAHLPGFRKGKIPESVAAQRFAAEIREELLEHLIPDALGSAIAEKGVQPLGRPRIEDLRFQEGQPLAFRANVDVRPPIDPGDYTGLPLHDVSVEPDALEIEQTLARILESHAEFLPIEGRPARSGDFAIADVASRPVEIQSPVLYTGSGDAVADEKAGEWERDEKITLEVGHPDSMPEVNEALLGASPSETRKFRKTFPADFPNEKHAGKTFDYEVTLVALKEKRVPVLDEEFARHVGNAESVAELNEKITGGIRSEKEAARRRKFHREILDNLLSGVKISPPEVLVEAEVESALEDYAGYLQSRGVDPKDADWDKLATDARPGAEKRVQEYLLLDEIARREDISVTETEVDAEVRSSAARRGVDFGELRDRLEKGGRLGSVRQEIRLQKAMTWLIDHASLQPTEPVAK